MDLMEEYEEAIKTISKFRRILNDAKVASVGLDDKLEFNRAHRDLGNAWKELRQSYFRVENAIELVGDDS